MSSNPEHRRLLARLADLYYLQDQTQAEIARRVHLSRQKVQRLLREARAKGVVRISIEPITGAHDVLERKLEQQLDLQRVIVVETADTDPVTLARDIGAAATPFLRSIVRPGDSMVISWGGTLLGVVDAMERQQANGESVTVIQGLGGLGDPSGNGHAADLTKRLAAALGGRPVLLPVPGVAASRAARKVLIEDHHVADALWQARAARIAIMGIGVPRRNSILVQEGHIVRWSELQELVRNGAVGDINLRFFDSEGKAVRSDLDTRVIGLTLNEISELPLVIGVAGGSDKVAAIRAAAKGKLIHVLVTDHATAATLAQEAS